MARGKGRHDIVRSDDDLDRFQRELCRAGRAALHQNSRREGQPGPRTRFALEGSFGHPSEVPMMFRSSIAGLSLLAVGFAGVASGFRFSGFSRCRSRSARLRRGRGAEGAQPCAQLAMVNQARRVNPNNIAGALQESGGVGPYYQWGVPRLFDISIDGYQPLARLARSDELY
jgi:hypothetical protein